MKAVPSTANIQLVASKAAAAIGMGMRYHVYLITRLAVRLPVGSAHGTYFFVEHNNRAHTGFGGGGEGTGGVVKGKWLSMAIGA